jgi:hypothetical protein
MKTKTHSLRLHEIFTAALLFLLVAFAFAGMARADETPWQVTEATDAQVLVPGGSWQPLTADYQLTPGTEVKVGGAGRVALRHGGDVVTLSPNSRMQIPMPAANAPSILQKLGTLLYRIEKRSPTLHQNVSTGGGQRRTFNVDTPYLAAVIKGTVFSINVSGQGAALHVTEGLVEAFSQATGERGLVAPGQTARVSSLPGAGLTISHGGKVTKPTGATGGSKKTDSSGLSAGSQRQANGIGADGTLRGATQGAAKAKGIKVAFGSELNVGKATKGLLTQGNAGSNASPKGIAARNGASPGRAGGNGLRGPETPGQLTAGLSGAPAITGVLPNGNTFPGNGNAYDLTGGNPGNGNPGGNNGNNGCNGNGNKPGC